jgi:hypothetical protein
MSRETPSRIWAILGVGVVTVVGLGLLLVSLGRGPGEPDPMITPAIPIPSDDPVVASVDGRPITQSFWLEAVLLDQVMSGLAGQPAPAPDETLQRLINEELVLQASSPEQQPTAEQIEARIAALEQSWGVDDAAVVTALKKVGLTRAALERTVGRLLAVEAGMEALERQGYDTTAWLEEQRASAQIVVHREFKDVAVPYVPPAPAPIAMPATSPIPTPAAGASFLSPIPTPPAEAPFLSPVPLPATNTPAPTPALAIPEVAPDLTLKRTGGGTFTLSEQLAQGPVVLVFFQRGGG